MSSYCSKTNFPDRNVFIFHFQSKLQSSVRMSNVNIFLDQIRLFGRILCLLRSNFESCCQEILQIFLKKSVKGCNVDQKVTQKVMKCGVKNKIYKHCHKEQTQSLQTFFTQTWIWETSLFVKYHQDFSLWVRSFNLPRVKVVEAGSLQTFACFWLNFRWKTQSAPTDICSHPSKGEGCWYWYQMNFLWEFLLWVLDQHINSKV